ncbi:MAG: calcium/sodium antiporter [Gemmatimonadota bacterium]|nr:calcium/sodium antiporter [Gemmatimonadota bacterium]MDH3368867.1 calcium/sodium antiporter [Gemmatimonadota bacterium]MDH3477697.1 calcium/sodium antiporter [Gemmatimonadota bacterium]MDH3569905.1 calcium/sodium antiporter [Gemmatimonadota bacterium]MDH5549298.1 calcium/sodium antiporter [Gemmatimonadota bacterium]
MSALTAGLVTAGGIALLVVGGELLVRGAVSIARLARVSTAVIGLTIVAIGTSAPELAVSLTAAVSGQPDIAVGNVVGSNIFNVTVILGVASLLLPLTVHMTAVRLEWPFMVAAAGLFLILARDGRIDRLEGGFFLFSLVAFLAYVVRASRLEINATAQREFADSVDALTLRTTGRRAIIDFVSVLAGLGILVLGAKMLVGGGTGLARLAGISDRVIGLTIAAAGTSLPELATSIVAARRGQPDIALANVLGSNIFNVLGILGIVALVTPQTVHPAIVSSDNWWMVGTALLLFPLMLSGRRIARWEGAVLLVAYAVYLRTLW